MVYVVIPVRNNFRYTRGCLHCLRTQDFSSLHVLVIDDGSTDRSGERLREEFPEVTLLTCDGNQWWAGAMARGVDHVLAQCSPDDFLLSLNNDTSFERDLVSRLVETSLRGERAIVAGCCVSSKDGGVLDVGGRFDWENCRRVFSEELDTTEDAFEFLTSRAVLYPVEVFRQAGNFDWRRLPHYHSDMEFTHRARQHGFRLLVAPRARVTVYETPETSGVHREEGEFLSAFQAWQVLTSRRSCFQPAAMFRFIDLCCPARYRVRNKLSFFLAALSASLGRTRLGSRVRNFLLALSGRSSGLVPVERGPRAQAGSVTGSCGTA